LLVIFLLIAGASCVGPSGCRRAVRQTPPPKISDAAEDAADEEQPAVAAKTAELSAKQLYARHCAACHGDARLFDAAVVALAAGAARKTRH
jgi:mono/diheme cytochrome c family protein